MSVCKTSLPDDGNMLFSEEEGYLMVVADGMGGAAAGERASALAVLSVETFVLNTLKWFFHITPKEENTLFNELRQGLERADRTVVERAGTTRTCTAWGRRSRWPTASATTSTSCTPATRAPICTGGGELQQLTSDHTLVQVMISGGVLAPEDAKTHPRRNVVTNVIGGPREGVHAEIHKLTIADGDILLLCSDGLTEPVDDEEIAETLALHPEPEDACKFLVERALDRGGPDNITVVVARYGLTPG